MQMKIVLSTVVVLGTLLVASTSGGAVRPTSQAVQQELAEIRAAYPQLPAVPVILWDDSATFVPKGSIVLRANWPDDTGWTWQEGLWHEAGHSVHSQYVKSWDEYVRVRQVAPWFARPELIVEVFAEDFRRCFGAAEGPKHTYGWAVGEPPQQVCQYMRQLR